ncbi:MAG TPA: DNA/RNA nuclease SfsA [Cellvibrio sp.]|nr:DNA/RNA nuclease SfsA [Cellvibrio sp.]
MTESAIDYKPAQLLRRYKRFLADVLLPGGEAVTLHCPNTGSMKNCLQPEGPCWYSTSANLARNYPHTLEVVTTPSGHLAGINTSRANALVEAAIGNGTIGELQGYLSLRREVIYGSEKSRIDFLLQGEQQSCYVEVKNVTLMEQPGQGLFPDAVSERGSRHLRELMQMVAEGHRAVLCYCVQHSGVEWVEPADTIDPVYGNSLRQALAAGVEVIAYRAVFDLQRGRIFLQKKLPIVI